MAAEPALRDAVERGERYMQRAPDAPAGYEIAGRARRALGEPGWEGELVSAAERYAAPGERRDVASAANLFRLAGDPRAMEHWQRALDDALRSYRHNRMEGEQAAAAAYFLTLAPSDSSAAEVDLDAVLDEVDDGELGRWSTVRAIRRATLAGDGEGLRAELDRWRRWASREPVDSNQANPSSWDMVEHLEGLIATCD